MRKLVAMMALATVCLFGAPQSTVISHAESTWQVEAPKEETQGAYTYLTYPNADGQTCWLYEVKMDESSSETTLTIPETIGGLKVTRIGWEQQGDYLKNLFGSYSAPYGGADGANAYTKRIKEITLPESITEIEACCFSGFDNISAITIPSQVTKLGESIFYGCNNLESVVLPEALEEMTIWGFRMYGVFEGCDKLNKIEISEKNTKYTAQNGCIMSKDKKTLYFVYSNKKTFKIPSTVTKVETGAFYVCSAKNIQISENVEELEKWALESYKIKNVTVSKKNKNFKKDGQSIYRTSDKSLAVAIAPKGKKYVMSDKVEKLTDNVSVIGSIDKQVIHEGVILKEIVLSKNLKKVEDNYLFYVNYLKKIKFQSAKPPKFKDARALPVVGYTDKIYVPKNSAKQYKKVYKKYKKWKAVKDNWSVY